MFAIQKLSKPFYNSCNCKAERDSIPKDIPIPVKPKLKLSDLPRPDTKIICVATFTRKGIVIRPKKIRIRKSRWSQLRRVFSNLKKQIEGLMALARK